MDVADEQQPRSIRQTYAALVVAVKTLVRKGGSPQVLPLELGIAKKDLAGWSEHFHVAVEQQNRLRMVVVFLVEDEASIGGKGEQALGGFNVLYLRMVELARELPILQNGRAGDEEQQHQSKYADVP